MRRETSHLTCSETSQDLGTLKIHLKLAAHDYGVDESWMSGYGDGEQRVDNERSPAFSR